MRLAGVTPAPGKHGEASRVSMQAPGSASVSVRFTVETRAHRLVQCLWTFGADYDGTEWRLDLNDVLPLTNY